VKRAFIDPPIDKMEDELAQLKKTVEGLQKEVTRLNGINPWQQIWLYESTIEREC
jgi:hypothetical protein